jgi:hypothetical protein
VQTIAGGEVCVRWARNITVTSAVTIDGTRAVVLIATGTINLEESASIDVSSDALGTRVGAGAARNDCNTDAGFDGQGGGGGAGGSFGTTGANGGEGVTNFVGGMAAAGPSLAFRAGCHGGRGGLDTVLNNGGVPGGAIYLIAGSAITLKSGTLNASGGGGHRAATRGGGGGGGSGGFIGLDAPSINIDAMSDIFALGGGGSPGGEIDNVGKFGGDPGGPTAPAMSVLSVSGCPGDGGAGSARTAAPSVGGPNSTITPCGGGGGGGGNGYIGIAGSVAIPSDNLRVAPPPVSLP